MEARPEVVLATAYQLVWPHLDERQRRLLLAAGARGLGRGGITAVAQVTGASRQTVHTALAELDDPAASGRLPAGRIRRPGGGRKRLTERDPDLLGVLDALVDPDTRRDPESPLRWTCSTRSAPTGQAAPARGSCPPAPSHHGSRHGRSTRPRLGGGACRLASCGTFWWPACGPLYPSRQPVHAHRLAASPPFRPGAEATRSVRARSVGLFRWSRVPGWEPDALPGSLGTGRPARR
jgi:hypothetical protein